jgi:hypothetical protein
MNERIKELMKEANKDIPLGKPFWSALEEFSEKFAELIVAECAEIARLNTREDSKVYLMIQEHFGVEE